MIIDLLVLIIVVAVAAWLIRYLEVGSPIDKLLYAVLVVAVVLVLIRALTGGGPVIVIR